MTASRDEHLVVVIAEDGTVSIEARGYSGTTCAEATAFLEEALGQRITERKKPEYYAKQRRDQPQRRET